MRLDAAVHLQLYLRQSALVQHLTQTRNSGRAARDVFLTAKAGVDRHEQHQIHIRQYLFHSDQRRGWIQRDAGLQSQFLDLLDRTMQVRTRLDMNRQSVGPSLSKGRDESLRSLDHQVHI